MSTNIKYGHTGCSTKPFLSISAQTSDKPIPPEHKDKLLTYLI